MVTDRQTDRQTDHATSSVAIGRIYVVLHAMRPKSNGLLRLSNSYFCWFQLPTVTLKLSHKS